MAWRKPKHQEFLLTLKDALKMDTAGLAKAIGKQTTNVTQYLSGGKSPGASVIRSAIAHLSEGNVTPQLEVQPKPENLTVLPEEGGIYALYDSAGGLLYVGQATDLRSEIRQTLNRKVNFPIRCGPSLSKKSHPKFKSVTHRVSVYVVPSRRLRHNLEALLLRVFANESHNNKLGRFR